MADLRRTIEIIFSGVDELSGSLGAMEKNLSSFGDGIKNIGAPFASAVEKVALLNAAIAGIAIAGIKASSDLENATAKMKASLGLPIEEAERFADIAKEVYKAGFGEDLISAFDAVTLAQKKLGDNAAIDIGRVTTQALQLQKAFGTDINDSLGATSTLMEQFGITSNEAMGFIIAGFQEGLNGSGDFIDSINEYSVQFAEGGADAAQFFSIMEGGFSEGMLGTDKVSDAFKEFRLNILEGSKSVNEALESLGLDPVVLSASLASGKVSVIDVFNTIKTKINETDDQVVKFNTSTALLGTPFEDIGTKAALGLNTAKFHLSDLQNTMDSISLGTFEEKFTSALRTITTEFADMAVWDDAKDSIADIFLDIAKSFDIAIDDVDFSGVADAFGEVWDTIQTALKFNDIDITTVDGMKNALEIVAKSLETVANVTNGIVRSFAPIFAVVMEIVDAFNSMDPDMAKLVGELTGLGAQLTIVGGIVGTGAALLGGLSTFAGLFSGALATGVGGVTAAIIGPVGLIAALAALATKLGSDFLSGDAFKAWAVDVKAAIAEFDLGDWAEETKGYFKDVSAASSTNLSGMDDSLLTVGKSAESAAVKMSSFANEVSLMPSQVQTDLLVTADQETILAAMASLEAIPSHKETAITIDADSSIDDLISSIDDIPSHKKLEVELSGDINDDLSDIKRAVKKIQPEFEWEANLDISNVTAQSVAAVSAFTKATDAVMSTMDWGGELSTGNYDALYSLLEKQTDLDERELTAQQELMDSKIAFLNAKTSALSSGDALITIDSSGLEPSLEMIMWQILEKIQIKATEEAADFLLGIEGTTADGLEVIE